MKAIFVALGTALYERVWLSYKSTILGVAVALLGETLNYFYLSVPDPRVHAACALLTTIFIAWKDKKVKEGAIKLLVIFLFASASAMAQGSPSARTQARAEALGGPGLAGSDKPVNPEALAQVIAQDPAAVPPDALPPPVPPKFGGCSKSGKFCFGPSVSVPLLAMNLTTGKIEAAFTPGIGYGFTYKPGSWDSLGVDAHLVVNPGAQQASTALIAKFINGYFRIGVSKGLIGDKSLRVPIGFGVDL